MKIFLLSLFIFCTSLAQAEFKVPPLQGPVMDFAGVMSPSDARELSSLLYSYNQRGKAQIQVLILSDLQGETIEQASIKIVDQWKLGDAKKDNGVLFLIAMQERKLRIEVGQGLEGALPDITAKRIIEDTVIPQFRASRASDGIVVGVYEIIQNVDQEFAAENKMEPAKKHNKSVFSVLFILFLLILISRGIGGGRGRGGGGGADVALAILAGIAGSGRGGRSGGGGWSGGGGGFSGGGASGGW